MKMPAANADSPKDRNTIYNRLSSSDGGKWKERDVDGWQRLPITVVEAAVVCSVIAIVTGKAANLVPALDPCCEGSPAFD